MRIDAFRWAYICHTFCKFEYDSYNQGMDKKVLNYRIVIEPEKYDDGKETSEVPVDAVEDQIITTARINVPSSWKAQFAV